MLQTRLTDKLTREADARRTADGLLQAETTRLTDELTREADARRAADDLLQAETNRLSVEISALQLSFLKLHVVHLCYYYLLHS